MRPTLSKLIPIAALATVSLSATADAALVFNNYANAGTYLDTVNAGSTNVRWYSVYAANASNLASLDISQLRIRLYKPSGYTGGASIEAFVAVANGADLATSYPSLVASGATAPAYTSLGTISLSSSGGTAANSVATWGTGATTLTTIALNNSWSTKGCFFVGFRFTGQPTTTANQVGIRLSTGTSSAATAASTGYIDNVYWKSTTSAAGAVTGPFGFNSTSYANVGCMDVNGTLVPAPGAVALLGVAGLIASRRRR